MHVGYGGRLRTIVRAVAMQGLKLGRVRYLAYTSDVGEAFRPLLPAAVVKSAYGVSWAYCGLDVALEGEKDHKSGKDSKEVTRTVVKRSIFQSVASMALPAFAIHTQVRAFSYVFKRLGRFQRWGPTCMGLVLVPFLPVFFDKPCEHVLDYMFDHLWPSKYSHHAHHEVASTTTNVEHKE